MPKQLLITPKTLLGGKLFNKYLSPVSPCGNPQGEFEINHGSKQEARGEEWIKQF